MSCGKDPYDILGVPRDASIEEIKRKWRTLNKKYHPDVSALPNEYATQKSAEINSAFGILKDLGLRADYDRTHGQPVLKVYDIESGVDIEDGQRAVVKFKVGIVSGVVSSRGQLTFNSLDGWLKVKPVKIKSLNEAATFPLEVWLEIITVELSRDVWNEGRVEVQIKEVVT